MKIEPMTCPACGGEYNPLLARAVVVVDGRDKDFSSKACKERGLTPAPPPPSDGPRLPEARLGQVRSHLWAPLVVAGLLALLAGRLFHKGIPQAAASLTALSEPPPPAPVQPSMEQAMA